MIYKKLEGKNGIRYMREGRLISVNTIPLDILGRLQVEKVVDDTPIPTRNCIFCGVETTWGRLVNNEVVDLCKEHYYSTTIGRVAQKMREKLTV